MITGGGTALTPDQRRIVEWGDGPLVVIAGAGTGKTRVIVERVKWLLETKGTGTRDGSLRSTRTRRCSAKAECIPNRAFRSWAILLTKLDAVIKWSANE